MDERHQRSGEMAVSAAGRHVLHYRGFLFGKALRKIGNDAMIAGGMLLLEYITNEKRMAARNGPPSPQPPKLLADMRSKRTVRGIGTKYRAADGRETTVQSAMAQDFLRDTRN